MSWYKIAQFNYEHDEERTTISSPYGSVTITETYPRYEFVDDLSNEEFEGIGIDEDEPIFKIEHIEIKADSRGQGYGTALMQEAMKELSRRRAGYVYLNASPMGFQGLSLNDLTSFYEKFGFNVIKGQGSNNLMGRYKYVRM